MTHIFKETERKEILGLVNIIKLENDFYKVSVFLHDDALKNKITISCKPKEKNFFLKALGDCVMIEDPELSSIRPQDVDDIVNRLQIAKDSAIALKQKLAEYM